MVTLDADTLWQMLNKNKFACQECGYRSPNRAHWYRHVRSDKHFLLYDFAINCPRDLKILVATFLPFQKLANLGKVGLAAVNLCLPTSVHWTRRRYCAIGPSGDPPARNAVWGVAIHDNLQSLAYVL